MSKQLAPSLQPDVLVIGGGNAALTAALTAREAGASVTVLEAAPRPYRGGNSRHTRNFRCMHRGPLGVLTGEYSPDEYFDDLLKVTKGDTDPALARLAIDASEGAYRWMEGHGVRFQPSLSGTLSLSRTNAFFLGGGKALVNALCARAEDTGIAIRYDAHVDHLAVESTRIADVVATIDGAEHTFRPGAVVAASGGFQADTDWLARAWGPRRATSSFGERPIIAASCSGICSIRASSPWAIRPSAMPSPLTAAPRNSTGGS